MRTILVKQTHNSPIARKIVDILSRQVSQRCNASVTTEGKGEITLELAVEPGVGCEGFRIADGPNGSISITGNDERGLLYGVGRFLRTSRYGSTGFVPSAWRGASVPAKPIRGIYFATHFHNFYHDAPIELVQGYVEELALWGFNELIVWFDMHHFTGIGDPGAQAMLDRLRTLLETAKSVGMGRGLNLIANEGYADSPERMRAQGPGRGGFYGVELCPNAPGALDLILRQFNELFDEFRDIGLTSVWIWPYDQGSCSCEKCGPWGSNGFLAAAQPLARLVRKRFPGGRVFISTWCLDDDEWRGLAKAFEQRPDWVDYIISERGACASNHSSPGDLPVVGFADISMKGMWPWGGFGANPMPQGCTGYWNGSRAGTDGGFPYSEGIYEDINKIVLAGLYWDPDRDAADILSEYISYEYCPDVVDEVLGVARVLERNHHMRWWPGLLDGYAGWFPSHGAAPRADPGAEDAYETARRVDGKLPEWARKSWRWRIVYLRALLDAELKANGGKPNDLCELAFDELTGIYHVENGATDVKPPGSRPGPTHQ